MQNAEVFSRDSWHFYAIAPSLCKKFLGYEGPTLKESAAEPAGRHRRRGAFRPSTSAQRLRLPVAPQPGVARLLLCCSALGAFVVSDVLAGHRQVSLYLPPP